MKQQPVKINDLRTALSFAPPKALWFLNQRTGELVLLGVEYLEKARGATEDAASAEDSDDLRIAGEVVDSGDYIALPDRAAIDEQGMMQRFCQSLDDAALGQRLQQIVAAGPQRQEFWKEVYRLGIHQDWYQFRDAELTTFAISWCREQGISYLADDIL